MQHRLCAAALSLLLLPILARTDDATPEAKVTDEEKTLIELTNKERAKENLPPLKMNLTLCKVARAHSENMAKQGMMKHELDGKTPSNRVNESGYAWRAVAENVAMSDGQTPEKIMASWMASPHHHDNILNTKYMEIGIGVAHKGKDVYYTQVFAKPAP